MSNVKLELKYSGIDTKELSKYKEKVQKIHSELQENKNKKDEFLGWLNLPTDYNKKEFEKIKKCAEKIKKDSEVLVVIGIGGSY